MRKIREILRLHYEMGLSMRAIGRSVSASHSTISDLIHRAKAAGLSWLLDEKLDEKSLGSLLHPGNSERSQRHPLPDWNYVHRELRKEGVTLHSLA